MRPERTCCTIVVGGSRWRASAAALLLITESPDRDGAPAALAASVDRAAPHLASHERHNVVDRSERAAQRHSTLARSPAYRPARCPTGIRTSRECRGLAARF